MEHLIRLANSLRRVTKWHEERISELIEEDSIETEPFSEFMMLFARGCTKEEIEDALQIDLTTADLSRWGELEW